VPYSDLDRLADDVVGFGPDVYVLEPPELRERVVQRVQAVLEAARREVDGP